MTPQVERYIAELRAARTDIDGYRIAIEIERDASTMELDHIVRETRGQIRVASLAQRLRQIHRLSLGDTAKPEPYQCLLRSDVLSHYRSADPGVRRLLLAFCGSAQLLFGPVARVLQYFPAQDYEVLVLRDPAKARFSTGLPGLGGSFASVISALRDRFVGASVRDIVTLGCSGGGGPALTAARLLSARAGVSFAGRLAAHSEHDEPSAAAAEMDEALGMAAAADQQLTVIHAQHHERDRQKSQALAQRAGCPVLVVPDFDGHNVLHYLHLTGRLGEVLRQTGLIGGPASGAQVRPAGQSAQS